MDLDLDKKDLDQLLHILIQTRRLTKLAVSTNAISYSEQDLILKELEQATAVLRRVTSSIQETETTPS